MSSTSRDTSLSTARSPSTFKKLHDPMVDQAATTLHNLAQTLQKESIFFRSLGMEQTSSEYDAHASSIVQGLHSRGFKRPTLPTDLPSGYDHTSMMEDQGRVLTFLCEYLPGASNLGVVQDQLGPVIKGLEFQPVNIP
ncbi:hypothetical protein M231_07676 [Tremella mesenterica]|uniref:Uncharacterized protein n=2 Tax=Tremella mesenterica TaxID=5217 RepID=A0A4Q1BBF0_TREME|nr:hypothetical protein M231_07676 [Tremella mesenterica]